MQFLKGKGGVKIVRIVVGDDDKGSTIFLPPGFDLERNLGSFTWHQLLTGVPIANIEVSLVDFLRLTEALYRILIETNQSELARQILPRGRQLLPGQTESEMPCSDALSAIKDAIIKHAPFIGAERTPQKGISPYT